MLIINKDYTRYTIEGMSVTEWLEQPALDGKLPDDILTAIDDDHPHYAEFIGTDDMAALIERVGTPEIILAPKQQVTADLNAQATAALLSQLEEIDRQSIRPNRTINCALAAGEVPNREDVTILEMLEAQAESLRKELLALQGDVP